MAKAHKFDVTEFCVECGAAREAVVDRDLECFDGVIAISHLIARRRMNELMKTAWGECSDVIC